MYVTPTNIHTPPDECFFFVLLGWMEPPTPPLTPSEGGEGTLVLQKTVLLKLHTFLEKCWPVKLHIKCSRPRPQLSWNYQLPSFVLVEIFSVAEQRGYKVAVYSNSMLIQKNPENLLLLPLYMTFLNEKCINLLLTCTEPVFQCLIELICSHTNACLVIFKSTIKDQNSGFWRTNPAIAILVE